MAPLTFRDEDEEARFCLSALRDGTLEEKVVARERLAAIFARRGLFEEAAELYELNIRAGVRLPEIFERLSAVYRHLGDLASAEAAFAEAQRVRSTPRSRPDQAPAPSPPAPRTSRPTSEPTGNAEHRVLPFPGQVPPRSAERPPTVTGPGSRLGLAAATGGRGSAAAALSPQVTSAPETDAARDPDLASAQADTTRPPAQPPVPEPTPLPDVMASGRTGRSVPGPVLVAGVVLFMIVLPVILLALLVVNPVGLYLDGRAAGPVVDVAASDPPRLKVATGTSATWYIQTGRSVSGLWATPGLELTLADDIAGVGRTFSVTAPRSQSWGDTITIVERRGQGRANQETLIPATFEVPSSLPPAGAVLDGRIAGQVTTPRLTESSQFSTSTQSIDVPVELVVVSGLDLWLDRFGNAVRMLFDEDRWLLVTIGAILTWCVLAGGAAILFRARQRQPHARA